MLDRKYYVYILANESGCTYIGVAKDLERRVGEHKRGEMAGFTKKYKIDMLMYYEVFDYVKDAIRREKQIKSWGKGKETRTDRDDQSEVD